MTAPAVTYPPADLNFYCHHDWPVDRRCEDGFAIQCVGCGQNFAPCTATRVDVRAVMDKVWQCVGCEGDQS